MMSCLSARKPNSNLDKLVLILVDITVGCGCQPHQESSFNLKLLQLPYVGLGPVCRWILKHHQVHHDIRSPRCITGESASVAKNWTTCSRAPPGLSLSFVPAATLLNGCSPQMPHLLFFSGEQLMRREFSAAGSVQALREWSSIARAVAEYRLSS